MKKIRMRMDRAVYFKAFSEYHVGPEIMHNAAQHFLNCGWADLVPEAEEGKMVDASHENKMLTGSEDNKEAEKPKEVKKKGRIRLDKSA